MKNLLLTQFDLHHKLYNNVLAGFTDEETNQRLHGDKKMNHVKYLAGHLLNSQYILGIIGGVNPDIKWNDLFAVMMQSKAKDGISYPSIEEIKSEWNEMHEGIRNGLDELAPIALSSKPPTPFDQVADSVGELWAFINHHQAYHIGQKRLWQRADEL